MPSWKFFIMMTLGNLCLAATVAFFIVPNNILTGGVAGVSIALYPLFHIPTVTMINLLTIGLFILGAVCLGKAYALSTIYSTICYPIFLSFFNWMAHSVFPAGTFVMEPWIASAYGGALAGLGLGLVFKAGGSTGGMDTPALILARYTPISQANAVMAVDSLTILLGIYSYGLEPALIGFISVLISAWVIDKVILYGSESAQNVFVISDKFIEIEAFLLKDISRGVTELAGRGGWTGEDRPILMCCISKDQYPALEEGVLKLDPKAFIILNSVNSIHGEGFRFHTGTI